MWHHKLKWLEKGIKSVPNNLVSFCTEMHLKYEIYQHHKSMFYLLWNSFCFDLWNWQMNCRFKTCTKKISKEIVSKVLLNPIPSRLCHMIQENNYEVVINFFHISHNLTWYSAIVQKFARIYPLMNWQNNSCKFL